MEHQTNDYGGGGKFTRKSFRPSRVSSASPYARPPLPANNIQKTSSKGWFSKLLVNPASKVLPSLFRISSSKNQDDRHLDMDQVANDETVPELEQEDMAVPTLTENNNLLLPKDSDTSARTKQVGSSSNAGGIEEIEQQLQQKRFSKDETDHLIELLRSRTTDPLDDNEPSKKLNIGASEYKVGQRDPRQPTKESYHVPFDPEMTPKSTNQCRLKGNGVGSSPVDIAKAYMESRSSSGYSNSEAKTSSLSFTPVAKSPMRWPGADAQNANGYFTPRRGIVPHHPRTPYSTLFSKSTSKYQANAERFNHSSSRRSTARVLDRSAMNTMSQSLRENFLQPITMEGTYEEAGPSMAMKNVLENSSTKSRFYKFDPSGAVDEASKFAAATPVHPHSSLTARKILEHLDRSVPSPKEKLQEIKLARMRVLPKSDALILDDKSEKLDVSTTNTNKTAEQQVAAQQRTGSSRDKGQMSPLRISSQSVFSFTPQTTSDSSVFQLPANQSSVSTTTPNEKPKGRDNGPNFTFPLPKTPNSFSEPPPTPTMPTSLQAASKAQKEKQGEENNVPLFNFGSSKKRLVFSFGSEVTPAFDNAPVFKFGSNQKRLSFKSLGGDAVCC